MVDVHHANWTASPGFKALHVLPRDAWIDLHGSEMQFVGDVAIGAGANSARLWLNNNTFRSGRLVVDNAGAPPSIIWDKFEDCAIETASGNSVPLVIDTGELHRTVVFGNSAGAPIQLGNTYRVGGSLQGAVVESNAAPSPWISEASVGADFVRLGTPLVLQGNLPPRMAGAWLIGISPPRPITSSPLFQFYFDTNLFISLRSVLIGNSQLGLVVPNNFELTKFEFYAQMLTAPVFGQQHVPPVSFPRGARFRIIP